MPEPCRLCGFRSTDQQETGKCDNCHLPRDVAAKQLPPFLEDELIADNTSKLGKQLNPDELKPHPSAPWKQAISEGSWLKVSEQDINYDGVLDPDWQIFLWAPASSKRLFVRTYVSCPTDDHWLTICGYVKNTGCLQPGDLLTIGQYPWVFHAYARGQGYGLEPGNPVRGSTLELEDLQVSKRLQVNKLSIGAGEFVGVIGASGSGKSTLIREIVERRSGTGLVTIDGISRQQRPDPAATNVAYVPQQDIVHDDLTIRQQVADYAQLVNQTVTKDIIDESIRIVGLRNLADRFPGQVSGGQLRRARLAAAFARQSGILLLDEPDSGLDPETALDVRRLLRTFSLLGATVIAVTHHRHGMQLFDRVIELDAGTIREDTAPQLKPASSQRTRRAMSQTGWFQFRKLFIRELVQFKQRAFLSFSFPWLPSRELRLPQWLLLVFLIPILFALAISVALPTEPTSRYQPHLAGFLCVLSIIWMASSQSHLALTDNFHRIEYESQQGLRPYLLLAAKSLFLFAVAILQTLTFFLAFRWGRHHAFSQPMFYAAKGDAQEEGAFNMGESHFSHLDHNQLELFATFLLVGLCASQMGLVISAMAKWRTLVATAILPIVMIVQILFSPFVVRASFSDKALPDAYSGFWLQSRCQGIPGCASKQLRFMNSRGLICQDCELDDDPAMGKLLTPEEIKSILDSRAAELNDRRDRFATIVSYGTITRHADLALRPLLGPAQMEFHMLKYGYSELRWSAIGSLILMAMIFHGFASLLMGVVFWRR